MSRIFLSYAREDNVAALAVFVWLEENGWKDDVFFDVHPDLGIVGGHAWSVALRNAADRCEAVIVLVSRAWLDSRICWSEFEMAERFSKAILPVLLEGDLDDSVIPLPIRRYQMIDRAKSPDEEFHQRLHNALSQSGTGPESFGLPADAHPYPGLGALTAQDAALFFGRDVEVLQTTEIMRDIRATGRKRLLVILGSSGSGKSSLLRAGLWPRLNRDDRNFLVLPVIRPVNAVLSGEAGLWRSLARVINDRRWARHLAPQTPRTSAAMAFAIEGGNPGALNGVLDALRAAAAKSQLNAGEALPDVVIPVDQAEELFSIEGRDQADRFLSLLLPLLAGRSRVAVVMTIRSDLIQQLQKDTRFAQGALRLFNLPPLPTTSLPEVIIGPAERMGLAVDPLLTSALLTDSRGADALPLLAFTLRELFDGRLNPDEMTLADYERIGGVRMAIQSTAHKARAATLASGVAAEQYAGLLRRCFIPHLVRINESGQAARRVALHSEFDADCLPAIRDLVDQRLLIFGADRTETTVEIAHEAVLREWPEVESLVAEHRDYLSWREQVSRQQAEYIAGRGDLLTGRALAIAHGFVEEFGQMTPPDLMAFVAASQIAAERERLAREAERDRFRQAELEAAQTRTREARRNIRRLGVFSSIVSILAIGLIVAIWQANNASIATKRAALVTESLRLAAQAQDLIGKSSWPAGRAIAWLALPHDAGLSERPITNEAATAIYRSGTETILDDGTVYAAIYASAGANLLLLSKDNGRIRVLNTVSGQILIDRRLRGWSRWVENAPYVEAAYDQPSKGNLRHPIFSSDGQLLSVVHGDETAEVWRLTDGTVVASARYDSADSDAILSQDGSLLVRMSSDNQLTLVDLKTGGGLLPLDYRVAVRNPEDRGPAFIDRVFEDPTRLLIWVVERDFFGYPTYSVFDRATGRMLRRFDGVGNDDVLGIDPQAGARLLLCGLNNSTSILDIKLALATDLPSASEAPQLGWMSISPIEGGFTTLPYSETNDDEEDTGKLGECAVSGDNRSALVNFGDQLALFDMATGQVEEVTGRFPKFLTSILANPYSQFLETERRLVPFGLNQDGSVIYGITGSPGSTGSRALVFHDVNSGELIGRIEPSPRIDSFTVDSAAHTAAIQTIDGAVSVWDVATGAKLADILGPSNEGEKSNRPDSENIQLQPAGNSLSITSQSTDDNGEITEVHATVYRLRPDAPQLVRSEFNYSAGRALNQGTGVILGTVGGIIERRGQDGQLLAQVQMHDGAVSEVTPAMGSILTAGWDGVVTALDPSNLAVIARVKAHDTAVSSLTVAPDGLRIATGAVDGAMAIWPGGLGATPLRLSGHEASISKLLFTATGGGLVSASHDGRILLHDAATGASLTEIVASGPPVWDMIAVPGSDLMVASRGRGSIIGWDQKGTAPAFRRWTLELGSRVRTMAVDPAGQFLALGLEDGRVLLKSDPAGGSVPITEQLRSLDGHRSTVVGLSLFDDGALLASLSRDRTLRLWDVESGRQVAVWEAAGNTPIALLTDADGRNVVTLFGENLVEFRRLPGTTLREVIANVGQALDLSPKVPFALCDQLHVTGIPGAERVCAPTG